jgi:hypothetical protein
VGFTLYFMTVDDTLTEQRLLAAFGEHISPRTDRGWDVRYDDENESLLDCTRSETGAIDSFSIDRPCGDDRLFESLFTLLQTQAVFLTYPAEQLVCVVGSEATAEKVRAKFADESPELVEALRVCENARDLMLEE